VKIVGFWDSQEVLECGEAGTRTGSRAILGSVSRNSNS
jgi:hypothetical protein